MLSYFESAMILLFGVLLVLGITHYLNRRLEEKSRKQGNGVNGWQLGILGTIYAVALGFMLSDAWLAYQTANVDAREEAAAVSSTYRTSVLLPASCTVPLQNAALGYLQTVINTEWPSMARSRPDWQGDALLQQMWQATNACDLLTASTYDRDQVIRALGTLQARRDSRIDDYNGHLPLMMWTVLLFGGVIVIAASCLLGNEKQSIHSFHVISLTVLITVMLLAISDLDRPFDGATHVDPSAFRIALANIKNQPST